jgi:hypothetical protein
VPHLREERVDSAEAVIRRGKIVRRGEESIVRALSLLSSFRRCEQLG